MRSGYLTIGMRLGVLLGLVRRHGISLRFVPRFLLLLQAALWASFLALMERLRQGHTRRQAAPPRDPLLIVSPWRTGTTLLHQLLRLDKRLICPTHFQCILPDSFLFAGPYARPVLAPFLRGPRPMDSVEIGFDEPQEDEYALYRLTGCSPLTRLVFPSEDRPFLVDCAEAVPADGEERRRWSEALLGFCARVQLLAPDQRLLLKNPFHGARIPLLLQLFPDARFLCIERDPLDVVPSMARMWRILGEQNTLGTAFHAPSLVDCARVLAQLRRRIENDLRDLPHGRVAHLRFEDLERDPRGTLRELYSTLGLPYTDELDEAIALFKQKNKHYKKNTHSLTPEEQALIRQTLRAETERCAPTESLDHGIQRPT